MLVLPTAIVGPAEAPELGPPATRAPVLWSLAALLAALFAAEALAVAAALHGWTWLPAAVVRIVTIAHASALLYPGHDLFAAHQLWTAALLHDGLDPARRAGLALGLWQLAANLVVLLVAGRAVERRLGSPVFAMALLVLAPLVCAVHLRLPDSAAALACCANLVAGILGVAWGLFAGHRVRWVAYYWLIAVVGAHPFRLDLRWLVVVYLAQELVRAALTLPPGEAGERACGLAAGLVLGFGLGTAGRLWLRRAP
jgi:hypothetical protein